MGRTIPLMPGEQSSAAKPFGESSGESRPRPADAGPGLEPGGGFEITPEMVRAAQDWDLANWRRGGMLGTHHTISGDRLRGLIAAALGAQ